MIVKAGRRGKDLEKFRDVTVIYWKRCSCYWALFRRSGPDDNELNFLRYVYWQPQPRNLLGNDGWKCVRPCI